MAWSTGKTGNGTRHFPSTSFESATAQSQVGLDSQLMCIHDTMLWVISAMYLLKLIVKKLNFFVNNVTYDGLK